MKYNVFEDSSFWDNYWKDDLFFLQKIRLINSLIPEDVTTILDVGCGNGALTRNLRQKQVVGCDSSLEAVKCLKKINILTLVCQCDALPFLEHSYDLVMCSQVLEHLPTEVFKKTLNEIERVSKKFLLISVPNYEILSRNILKCPQCRHVYHISGHVRMFKTLNEFKRLFPGFHLRASCICGPSMKWTNSIKFTLMNFFSYTYSHHEVSVCPICGALRSSLKKKTCHWRLKLMLDDYIFPFIDKISPDAVRPWWSIALLERKNGRI